MAQAFYEGQRGEEIIALNDDAEVMELLRDAWSSYDGSEGSIWKIVTKVLGYEKNWKQDLNNVEGLNDTVTAHLINIKKHGMEKAVGDGLIL